MTGFDTLIKEIAKGLAVDKEMDFSQKELKSIIYNYYRTIRYIMEVGKHGDETSFIRNIVLTGIGVFRFNNRSFRFSKSKRKKANTLRETYIVVKEVKAKGWVYFDWSEKLGHTFMRHDGLTYNLKCSSVGSKADAYIEFNKVIDNKLIERGIEFTCYDDIKEVELHHGKIAVYNGYNELVRVYETLEDAHKDSIFSIKYIHSVLLYNKKDVSYPKRIKDEYYFFCNNPKKYRSFNRTYVTVHNLTRYDLLDADTGEVLIENIGNASEIVEYINSLGRANSAQVAAIKKACDENRVRYGFRYRKCLV